MVVGQWTAAAEVVVVGGVATVAEDFPGVVPALGVVQ